MYQEPVATSKTKDKKIKIFKAHPTRNSRRGPMGEDPILVLAVDTVALTFPIERLRNQGRDVAVCSDMGQFQNLLGMPIEHWSMLIIEIEGFGGISAVIGKLMMLRQEHPNLPVLIASTRMPAHDFTLERLPICDASLALPCSASDLNVAVQNALMNNIAWQMRLEEIENAFDAEPWDDDLPALAKAG
jgi:hypothetical protein